MSKFNGSSNKRSWFELEVARAMGRHGVQFEEGVKVGPFELDFLWRGKVFDVAVEADGGSHMASNVAAKDIARDSYFRSHHGVRTFRIPYWSWREVRPMVEMDLLGLLARANGEECAPLVKVGGLSYDRSWWERKGPVSFGQKTRSVARMGGLFTGDKVVGARWEEVAAGSLEAFHALCFVNFAGKNPLVYESAHYRQLFRYKFMYLVEQMREGR